MGVACTAWGTIHVGSIQVYDWNQWQDLMMGSILLVYFVLFGWYFVYFSWSRQFIAKISHIFPTEIRFWLTIYLGAKLWLIRMKNETWAQEMSLLGISRSTLPRTWVTTASSLREQRTICHGSCHRIGQKSYIGARISIILPIFDRYLKGGDSRSSYK